MLNRNRPQFSPEYAGPYDLLTNEYIYLEKEIKNAVSEYLVLLQKCDIADSHQRRGDIIQLIKELQQTYTALVEICSVENKSQSRHLDKLSELQDEHSTLTSKINWFENESSESQTLRVLHGKMENLEDEIDQLEQKLAALKQQRRLITTQVQETESLLEIKCSKYNNALEYMEENINDVIKNIVGLKLVPVKPSLNVADIRKSKNDEPSISKYNAPMLINVLQNQITNIGKFKRDTENNKKSIEEGLAYLSDIFKNVNTMEDDVEAIATEIARNSGNKSLNESMKLTLLRSKSYLETRKEEVNALSTGNTQILAYVKRITKGELNMVNAALDIVNSNGENNDKGEKTDTIQEKERNDAHATDEHPEQKRSSFISSFQGRLPTLSLNLNKKAEVKVNPLSVHALAERSSPE